MSPFLPPESKKKEKRTRKKKKKTRRLCRVAVLLIQTNVSLIMYPPSLSCRIAVISIKPTFLSHLGIFTPALRAPSGRPSTFSSVLLCLSLSFCLTEGYSTVALKLRSLPFTRPVYVASRYFQ